MPTEGEKLKIRRLVAAGRSYQQIADELPGWTPAQARHVAYREGYVVPKSKPRGDRAGRLYVSGEFGIHAAGLKMDYVGARPKPDTLAERDRAYAAPRTLTAIVFGDPPPGRSALDKRRA